LSVSLSRGEEKIVVVLFLPLRLIFPYLCEVPYAVDLSLPQLNFSITAIFICDAEYSSGSSQILIFHDKSVVPCRVELLGANATDEDEQEASQLESCRIKVQRPTTCLPLQERAPDNNPPTVKDLLFETEPDFLAILDCLIPPTGQQLPLRLPLFVVESSGVNW